MSKLEDASSIGDWVNVKTLGKGSFGEVNLWKNKKTNANVAIKKCTAKLTQLPADEFGKLKKRWLSELEMMKNHVTCDYIVRTVNVDPKLIEALTKNNPSCLPLLIMEYCENGDLRQTLCKIENSNGLKEAECKNILKSLRYAVEHLHKLEISHRDIKPENIVIQVKNERNVYKLTDLGYAKQICRTAENSCVGTPGYFAPEIITGAEYSRRVDYWSIGVIAFEIICGIRPFIPHQTIVRWMLELKEKSSKTIAITENNKDEFIKHQKIFNENKICDTFKSLVEKWLVLALEFDQKQRGSEFVTSNRSVPDEVQLTKVTSNIPKEPPQIVCKFYSELDAIIKTKILKMFCLTHFKFISYTINEDSTMNDLKNKIHRATGIPEKEMYFVIPIESKVQELTVNTKPLDFYVEDYDHVMLFVTHLGKICEHSSEPYISCVIQDVLQMKKDENLKTFYLKEFARHVVHLLRTEQDHYNTLLKGLKNYALNLNDVIEKSRTNVEQMKNKTLIAFTKVNCYVAAISHSKKKLEDKNLLAIASSQVKKWEDKCNSIEEKMQKFYDINLYAEKRYESVLKRSRKALESKFLEEITKDHFELDKTENKYQLIRHLKDIDKLQKFSESFRDSVFNCIETRKTLLIDNDFENLQKTITEVHIEFIKINSILMQSEGFLTLRENEIEKAILEYQNELWELHERLWTTHSNGSVTENFNQNNLPDLDSIMNTPECNGKVNFILGGLTSNMYNNESLRMDVNMSCFGESENTIELIKESNDINLALQDLVTDFADILK